MANNFELIAERRQTVGKAASRRMRRLENKIPAIIYGGNSEPQSLTLNHNKMLKALENKAFYSHILTIDIDGKKEKAVLRQLQRHPVKAKILHADFQRISETEKLTMSVPLHLIGEEDALGVKEGGIVAHLLSSIEISCLPKDLPEKIDLDISQLELDASLHLSDIKPPHGVEIVELTHGHHNDLPVVSIHLPRAAYAEETATEQTISAEVPTISDMETSQEGETE